MSEGKRAKWFGMKGKFDRFFSRPAFIVRPDEHHPAAPISDPQAPAHLIEIGRRLAELAEQDEALRYLPVVLLERLRLMCSRGERYNGDWSTLEDQIFYMGDQSAYHAARRPIQRMAQIIGHYGVDIPTEQVVDMIMDASNYLDLWRCCRKEREANRVERKPSAL